MAKLVDAVYRKQALNAEEASLDTFEAQALNMILSPRVREAFDLSKEPEKLKDAYGRHTLGQSALMARRLVEAGSRFVTVIDTERKGDSSDLVWDTHSNNDKLHRDILVPGLDQV